MRLKTLSEQQKSPSSKASEVMIGAELGSRRLSLKA